MDKVVICESPEYTFLYEKRLSIIILEESILQYLQFTKRLLNCEKTQCLNTKEVLMKEIFVLPW